MFAMNRLQRDVVNRVFFLKFRTAYDHAFTQQLVKCMPFGLTHLNWNHIFLFLWTSCVNRCLFTSILCESFSFESTSKGKLTLRKSCCCFFDWFGIGFLLAFLLWTTNLKLLEPHQTRVFFVFFRFWGFGWFFIYWSSSGRWIRGTKSDSVSFFLFENSGVVFH